MILAIERGSNRSYFVENWLWKMLWNCCKTVNRRNEGMTYTGGPVSSVGIESDDRLDGPGIKSRWGRDFPHLARPALGTTQPPLQWVPDLSWW
jgi:hypothetical protein